MGEASETSEEVDVTIDLEQRARAHPRARPSMPSSPRSTHSRADDVERAHEVLADVTDIEPRAEPDSSGSADGPAASDGVAEAGQDEEIPVTETGEAGTETEQPVVHAPLGVTSLLERRDAATDEIERQLARRLKRLLSDEQNDLLDQVRRVKGEPMAEEILPAMAEHAGRYASAAGGDLAGAASAGRSSTGIRRRWSRPASMTSPSSWPTSSSASSGRVYSLLLRYRG